MERDLPPAGITPDDWAATPLAVRQFMDALLLVLAQHQQPLADQQQQIAHLQARLADLEARLNQHSQNSSKPPSSDPASAPPRLPGPARGRSRGAQPGQTRHERPPAEPDHIDTVRDHYPDTCAQCQTSVSHITRDACAAQTQYVSEIPVGESHITAHYYHTVCCPGCGTLVTAPRAPDVPPGSFGPRTAATVALLHGRYWISDREIPCLLHDFAGLPIRLGSVVELQQTVSVALAPVYSDIHTCVQQQAHVNRDETTWKEAGKRGWLWVIVTTVATFFQVAVSRSGKVITRLLGDELAGLVSSERLKSYQVLAPERRQLGWGHLLRNLLAYYKRDGRLGVWAADMLGQIAILFALWHAFGEGRIDRATLVASMPPVQTNVRAMLERGQPHCDQAQGLSAELLALWPAVWRFVTVEGVEPTTNAAERALRAALLWRKGCFGAHSAAGNLFVERILTLSATCQQQNRQLRTFLTEAVSA
jgi:transposase